VKEGREGRRREGKNPQEKKPGYGPAYTSTKADNLKSDCNPWIQISSKM